MNLGALRAISDGREVDLNAAALTILAIDFAIQIVTLRQLPVSCRVTTLGLRVEQVSENDNMSGTSVRKPYI